MGKIIVLNGLIASGKTTIGKELVKALNNSGEKAVFFDLDDEVLSLNLNDSTASNEERLKTWLHARKNIALQTLKSLKSHKTVVIAGPFYFPDEIEGFTTYITIDIPIYLFTLDTNLTNRLERNSKRLPPNDSQDIHEQEEKIKKLRKEYGYTIESNGSINEVIETIRKLLPLSKGLIN